MKTTTSQHCPVFWHQGLLLQPQHLQLESRFHQASLQRLVQLLHNEPWGVLAITLREDALAEKHLVISSGEFLFPDGSLCHVPNNSLLASRTFEEAWVEAGQLFVIYLGLKQWQEQGNVAESEETSPYPAMQHPRAQPASVQQRRMQASTNPIPVPDCHGDGIIGKVRILKYHLRIFWQTEVEQAGDYMLMPVASLERDGSRILLSGHFVPPILNVHDWPYLRRLLADIKDQLVSRARQLESFKQFRPGDTTPDVSFMLALQALTRCACTIQLLMDTPQLPPRQAWSALAAMLAELSYLIPDLSVAGVAGVERWPDYDHLNLSSVFNCLVMQLKQALNRIVVGPEYTIRLKRQGEAIWRTELPKRALNGGPFHYWLAFTNVAASQVAPGFERLVKLAAGLSLITLQARAVSGIVLTPQTDKPAGLPRLTDGIYCAIEASGHLWQQVVQSAELALFWEADEQAQVVLYVTRV